MTESIRDVIKKYKRKQEDSAPHAGVYYIVPQKSKPEMVLVEYQESLDDDVLHVDFWDKIAKNLLAGDFGLDAAQTEKLADSPYGVPRGRVVKPEWHHMPVHTGKWLILYGGPTETPPARKGEILKEFNLNSLHRAGKVAFVVDEHERMEPLDKSVVRRLLGG